MNIKLKSICDMKTQIIQEKLYLVLTIRWNKLASNATFPEKLSLFTLYTITGKFTIAISLNDLFKTFWTIWIVCKRYWQRKSSLKRDDTKFSKPQTISQLFVFFPSLNFHWSTLSQSTACVWKNNFPFPQDSANENDNKTRNDGKINKKLCWW